MKFNISVLLYFQGLLKTDKTLRDFVLNPLISKALKKEGIESVLAKKSANALTVNFFSKIFCFYYRS